MSKSGSGSRTTNEKSNQMWTCEYCPGFWTCNLSRLNKHNKTKSHQKMKSISEAREIIDFHQFQSDVDITKVKQEVIMEDDESSNFGMEEYNGTNYCVKEENIEIKEELENVLEQDNQIKSITKIHCDLEVIKTEPM